MERLIGGLAKRSQWFILWLRATAALLFPNETATLAG